MTLPSGCTCSSARGGEFQAAAKLADAADVLSRFPIAVQLRYLQTMREVASERNTTTFFPAPAGSVRVAAPRLQRRGAAQELVTPAFACW